MRYVYLLLVACFACSTAVAFDGKEPQAAQQAPSTSAPAATEAEARVAEADLQLSLAKTGQYGRLKRGDMDKIEASHQTMVGLLANVGEVADLTEQQQDQLEAAQSSISTLLRANDPNREVCKRAGKTGSRIGVMECLTIAQREARARASRNMIGELQRGFCVPGADEVSRCGR
jgi:hypothetical protein